MKDVVMKNWHESEDIQKWIDNRMETIELDDEYLEWYQNKYGNLDEEGKEKVLKSKHEADNWTREQWEEFIDLVMEVGSVDLSDPANRWNGEDVGDLDEADGERFYG